MGRVRPDDIVYEKLLAPHLQTESAPILALRISYKVCSPSCTIKSMNLATIEKVSFRIEMMASPPSSMAFYMVS